MFKYKIELEVLSQFKCNSLELIVWYGIMMVLPLGAAVKMREILTSSHPEIH